MSIRYLLNNLIVNSSGIKAVTFCDAIDIITLNWTLTIKIYTSDPVIGVKLHTM